MSKGRHIVGKKSLHAKSLVTGSSDKLVPSGVWVRTGLEFLGSRVRAHEARVFKFMG